MANEATTGNPALGAGPGVVGGGNAEAAMGAPDGMCAGGNAAARGARTWEDAHAIPGALTKSDVYALLDAHSMGYEAVEHPAVFTVEEADALAKLPFAEHEAKNFFLRDPKHREYYLVTVPDHKKVDLKALQAELHSKRLSFASAEDLAERIGIYPGAVTPFAALNAEPGSIHVALDADFRRWGRVGCHPCSNTASVHVRTDDLLALLSEAGHEVVFVEL